MVNIVKNFLIMLKNLQQMHLELLQKESFKKQQKQLVISLVITLLIKLQKFQKIRHKIIQRQFQMIMIKKYLKKNICLQKKDKKLLMNYKKSQKFQKIHNKIIQRQLQMTKERYISPEKRQKIIYNVR